MEKDYVRKALERAERIGVIEYRVNGRFMEYWSFYENGWYFIRHDLDIGEDVFREKCIPFMQPVPAFLVGDNGGMLYNYEEG